MAKFVLGCSLAVAASADCLADLENVVKDVAGAGEAIKGLVHDCTGDDRSQCATDVGSLLDALDKMQTDIAPCTTSCGSHGKACTDAINQLGTDIGAIKEPAQDMADKCAGKDKSIVDCGLDGVKVGAASAKVLSDVHSTYETCKSGSAQVKAVGFERDAPNGIGCDVCKEVINKGVDAGVTECHSLCQKAGSLDGVCEQACDLISTECHGTVDCATKVCTLVKLCGSEVVV